METATGSQAVSPNSLPTAARSRCGARRAALTSFLAHSPLCCGCNSSARPSFRPENDARTGSLFREGALLFQARTINRVRTAALRANSLRFPDRSNWHARLRACGRPQHETRFFRAFPAENQRQSCSSGPAGRGELPTDKAILPEGCERGSDADYTESGRMSCKSPDRSSLRRESVFVSHNLKSTSVTTGSRSGVD
jgi:hypothetical protein